ncbi:hypothetical protein ARNL5_02577 [Anaerolineae bacterium]|nr:hypothetical protein ARNL5_02577 [Anaerolineae bacterium]
MEAAAITQYVRIFIMNYNVPNTAHPRPRHLTRAIGPHFFRKAMRAMAEVVPARIGVI